MGVEFKAVTVTPEAKANEWIEPIAALAAQNDTEAGYEIPIAWKGRNAVLGQLRDAAKLAGKTLRIRKQDESGLNAIGKTEKGKTVFDGNIVYTVTLTDKYKDGRGRKTTDAVEAQPETAAKSK